MGHVTVVAGGYRVKPSVVSTTPLPSAVLKRVRADFGWLELPLQDLGIDGFLARMGHPAGLVVRPGDPIDAAFIDRLPESVKVIASYSVGLDHVDVRAARARGIVIGNTPDVLTDATADVAMMLIIGSLRGVPRAARMLREGEWTGWQPSQVFGRDLAGKTLGIFGAGRIGTATAKRARAFKMRLAYWSGHRRSPGMDALEAEAIEDWDAFLGRVDVVSLHAPSTPQTRGLFGPSTLGKLRAGSVLVNTARGDLVDDDAVIAAVEAGHLAAVGLDVYAGEPHFDRRYLTLENAFLLPHMGSASEETRLHMGEEVHACLKRALLTE